jgi:hypothetical protein
MLYKIPDLVIGEGTGVGLGLALLLALLELVEFGKSLSSFQLTL